MERLSTSFPLSRTARGNALDRAIAYVAPRWGARRVHARLATMLLQDRLRKFEGAAGGRRMAGWRTSSASATSEAAPALSKLRNRCRDLSRNNCWASKAVRVIAARTVGGGIIPTPQSDTRDAKRMGELWTAHMESTAIDVEGRRSFGAKQNLAMRCTVESGEVLLRRVWVKKAEGLPLPFQIQLLEPDHLDADRDRDSLTGGGRILQGVEFDKRGRRVAYWLFPDHPGETLLFARSRTSVRVPAADIIHNLRDDRIGQVRGIPWGSPCVVKLRDYDVFEDARLQREAIAACFVAFTKDIDGDQELKLPNTDFDALEPGTVEHLASGRDITFARPPQVEGYREYARTSLQGVAAGYGTTYEALTGDLEGVSFSAGRMGWLEFHAEVHQWRHLMFIPNVCQRVWQWAQEAAYLAGEIGQPAGIPALWTAPRREMIDPAKEGKALAEQVQAGFLSLSEALRQLGFSDPEKVIRELARDRDLAQELGLTLSTILGPGGVADAPPDDGEGEEEGEEDDEGRRRQPRARAGSNGRRMETAGAAR